MTALGHEVPRVFTPPLRPLTPATSLGFTFADFCADVAEVPLLPWERWLGIHALEVHADGSLRFRTVILLVARQNGKSMFLQLLSLYFMFVMGSRLVIGTAQNLDIAEEVWAGAVSIAEGVPELAAEIRNVVLGSGKKALELRGGERYKVAAASRRGGRGLSGDLVLLDELREHQSWDAWGAVTKTTMARAQAMIWAASNAGDAASIVLRFLRRAAHLALGDPDGLAGTSSPAPSVLDEVDVEDQLDDSLGIFEWSAVPGCAVDDRDAWAAANPSLGYTITERAIRSALATDPEWVFRTEVLCQWWDGSAEGPFPSGSWDSGLVDHRESVIVGEVWAGIDLSFDRTSAYVAFAGRTAAGRLQVELVAAPGQNGGEYGTSWLKPWLKLRHPRVQAIAGQKLGAPISGILADWVTAAEPEVPVVEWGGPDLTAASAAFYDLIRLGQLAHLAQPLLDIAAATAVTRPAGDSWLWDRRKSPTDIAPLIAANAAVWLATRTAERPFVSAYESGGVLTI